MGSQIQKKISLKIIISIMMIAIFIILPVVTEIACVAGFIPGSPAKALLNAFDADAEEETTEFVEFLRVGQGDCTVIKSGDMAAVIDFGETDEDDSIYYRLLEIGVTRLDLAVITHHHNDHMGGFLNLLENMTVDRLLISSGGAEDSDNDLYKEIITAANKAGTTVYEPKVGGKFQIGNARLEILYVDTNADEENNRSIITKVHIGGKKLLFTGDAESETEKYISENCDVDCDILKMGHHGSYTSTGYKLLKAATPKIAVASCGYDNIYGHPSQWSELRLKEMNVTMYRTDLDRNIRCTFDNGNFTVSTQREGLK